MPTVFIRTYGCQMNERDSEAVAARLLTRGFALAPSMASADVVLLNTCSVRAAAERKAVGLMQQLIARRSRTNTAQLLGFLGCMAQSRGADLLRETAGVDLVLGTHNSHRLPEKIEALLVDRSHPVCDVSDDPSGDIVPCEHLATIRGQPRAVTAFVSIMQGCNRHCAFCLVPSTRGPERSRPMDEIVVECRHLAESGVREVTLLGQIVTNYGRGASYAHRDISPFVRLLEAVHGIDGIERIRFMSPHPAGFGDDTVDAFGRMPKLCPHAHLPRQSGSNGVLRQMRRGHTREEYLALVDKLRRANPGMGFTTDLIVGFPGETDADFAETIDLVGKVEFDNAFVFKYSARPDTPAAHRSDVVPAREINERHATLFAHVNQIARRRYERFIGQQAQVLVEGPSRRNAARFEGRTRCNKIVVFPAFSRQVGELVNVRITRSSLVTLYGEPVVPEAD